MQLFYEVNSKNFKPFCILKRFNIDHSEVEFFKFNVYGNHNEPGHYHQWTHNLESARVLTKSEADELFSHMINRHRGDNYRIIEFNIIDDLEKFNPKKF